MNVLVYIDEKLVYKAIIMLCSLLENNNDVNLYCISGDKIGTKTRNYIDFNLSKYYIKVNYIDNLTSALNLNDKRKGMCADYIAYCYKFLPESMDRILYISWDVIINGKLQEYYLQNFDKKSMIVRGQSEVLDSHHRNGARPEKGQFFDSRVLLVNVKWFKNNDFLYKPEKALSFQQQLNVSYKDNVKYVIGAVYNYRFSILKEMEKNGMEIKETPIIIGYENRDYFFANFNFMPWDIEYNITSERILHKVCDEIVPYDFRRTYQRSFEMFRVWHEYAKCSDVYERIMRDAYSYDEFELNLLLKTQIKEYRERKKELDVLLTGEKLPLSVREKIKYKDLVQYIDTLDSQSAITVMNNLFSQNIADIKKKDVIHVGFFVYSSAEWQCDLLYKRLEKMENYEPVVIILYQEYGDKEVIEETYQTTRDYFKDGYNVVSLYKDNMINEKKLKDLDILMYFSPFEMQPFYANALERSINELIMYTSYAYFLVDKDDVRYGETFFDRAFYKILWKFWAICKTDIEYASARQRMKGYNIELCGFPKLDEFVLGNIKIRPQLWKCNGKTKLRLIWAPHFNMEKGMNGTFHMNYRWFLEYASTHKEISWIVRPHPRFAVGAIEAGVFKNKKEVDEYWAKWESLENARVISGGTYYDIFQSSDAMILDSGSFLAEYQFVHKPLLFLLSDEPRKFGGLGEDICEVIYKENGADFEQIELFIDNCKKGLDKLKIKREKLFKEKIDYMQFNNKTATEYILETLNLGDD